MIRPGTQIASVSALSNNIFEGVLDVSDLRSATLHVSGTFDLSLTVEVSNDLGEPTHWIDIAIIPNTGSRGVVSAITESGMYSVSLGYRALRVRCTEYGSGSALVNAVFSKDTPLDGLSGRTSPTDRYRFTDYDDSGTVQYFGYTDENGGWYIMALDTGNKEARYAKGDSGYTTAWTGRASLSYGYFSEIF